MKLDYKRTFLLGFGFLGVSFIWLLYNSHVPSFLQAGNPAFDQTHKATTVGFGLSAMLAGLTMTLDNIAAFFIQPILGIVSDRTRTRIDRRMLYILIRAPLAAFAFAVIPVVVNRIPPELSGQTSRLGGPLASFMIAIGVTLLAFGRVPHPAHRFDARHYPLAPALQGQRRDQHDGRRRGAPGHVWRRHALPHQQGDPLFGGRPDHGGGGGRSVEAQGTQGVHGQTRGRGALVGHAERDWRYSARGERRSLVLILLAIFAWFVGYNAIEPFFTSYGTFRLGVAESTASMLLGFFSLTLFLFSIPGGMLAERWGRRRTILTGLVALTALLLLASFLPNEIAIAAILFLGGMAWALININSLPMVVDLVPSDRLLGTYTGLYYISGTLAAIAGLILNGWIIDATGKNYNTIFGVAPVFMLVAIVSMGFVTRGEARTS